MKKGKKVTRKEHMNKIFFFFRWEKLDYIYSLRKESLERKSKIQSSGKTDGRGKELMKPGAYITGLSLK